MAIAYDAGSNKSAGWYNASGGSITLAHTISGSDTMLLVYVVCASQGDYATGVTYAGVAMTKIGYIGRQDVPTVVGVSAWYLFAPTTGTNNIVATLGGGAETTSNMQGASYTGVNQVAPEASNTKTEAPGTTAFTLAVTTLTNNAWIAGHIYASSGATITAGSNTTLRAGIAYMKAVDSNADQTPTGSKSFNYTAGSNGYWLGWIISIAPYVAPAGPANLKSYNTNLKANIKSINTNVLANIKSLNTNT